MGECVPAQSKRRFIGIDIDIRDHNRRAIEAHPMSDLITLYEGSSVDPGTINYLRSAIRDDDKVLVILDSNHTHTHVAEELRLYSELVSVDSFLIVHDTGIEFAEETFFDDRDWGKGNNPLTALHEFLSDNKDFQIAEVVNDKLLITSSPQGYVRRVR
jgi:cephalosporin hydroxylase